VVFWLVCTDTLPRSWLKENSKFLTDTTLLSTQKYNFLCSLVFVIGGSPVSDRLPRPHAYKHIIRDVVARG